MEGIEMINRTDRKETDGEKEWQRWTIKPTDGLPANC